MASCTTGIDTGADQTADPVTPTLPQRAAELPAEPDPVVACEDVSVGTSPTVPHVDLR